MVEHNHGRKDLERDLKAIDNRLFFEKQLTLEGEEVWCVVCDFSSDQPPVTLLEWRDSNGRPISELGSSIIPRVQKMERDHDALLARVREQNEKMVAEINRRRDEAYEEIARDMIPRIQERGRPVLPRGVYLRQSRSRMREQGKIR